MHFCLWDIPALILLIGAVALVTVNIIRGRRMERGLEDELSAKMAAEASAADRRG